MATILDYFSSPHFTARALTDAVNIIPNMYGRLGELNLFPVKGIPTTYVEIEYKNGVLSLLPARERGAPGTQGSRGRRHKRIFDIPHIPHDDALLAKDLQNAVKFGTNDVFTPLKELMSEKLVDMQNRHLITLEHLRMSALKGVIVDADGSVIYDLFDEFKITQKVISFGLSNKDTDVSQKCRDLKRYIEKSLMGEVTDGGIRVLVSPEFFDLLIAHPKVADAYKYYSSTQEPLRNDLRAGFKFHGITFEEYVGEAPYTQNDGSLVSRRFIAEGEGHAWPTGTRQTFQTYAAPPDTLNEVNLAPKSSDLIFAMQEKMDFDKGIQIHTESNPLPFVKRPALLVKVIAD